MVCDSSAAFSILDVNPLQHFLSSASSVISARSLLESSLIGSRSLLNTVLPERLCFFVEFDQRDSSEQIRFVMTVAFLGRFYKATWKRLG